MQFFLVCQAYYCIFCVKRAVFRVLAATSLNGSQPNFAQCLAVSWAGTLHIHFLGLLPRYGILPGAKFTFHPSRLVLSYFVSVTARHLSSGSEPDFVALSTGCRLYSAGRPSRWALAHILVCKAFEAVFNNPIWNAEWWCTSFDYTINIWLGEYAHAHVPDVFYQILMK